MVRVALALVAVWVLLSGGDPESWIIGVPAVAAGSWSAHRLRRERRTAISFLGLARFAPLFLWGSLRGGVDVARRILAPTMSVRPGFRCYRTSLFEPSARVFFATCVNLLPGTLTAKIEGDQLRIHQLDITADTDAELRRFERAVARVFGAQAEGRAG